VAGNALQDAPPDQLGITSLNARHRAQSQRDALDHLRIGAHVRKALERQMLRANDGFA
jgi:hypothetical protein